MAEIRPARAFLSYGAVLGILVMSFSLAAQAQDPVAKKIVFIAGPPSHGYGEHEHNAGSLLLADALRRSVPDVEVEVHQSGWPEAPDALDDADAVVIYCDGGEGHIAIEHLDQVERLVERGVGIACLHYAVEVPKGEPGDALLDAIGGYFEIDWSVNPHWTADFQSLPDHPITRGIKPFAINDEWYYHMRFRDDMQGITPILSALPPASTLTRPDGPHSGNPHVRAAVAAGEPQHVAWAFERPGGGRGFGFTGGHFHQNWANDNVRRLVLNAILWIAGAEVPDGGVADQTPTTADLEKNQDEPKPNDGTATTEPTDSIDPHPAGAAVAALDVAEGLKATLFASEPMMLSPSNIDIDHRGRVWVCEIVNYRHFANENNPRREEGDRILILEDTNGDGRADLQKVFYQGTDIDSPHGITVLGTPDGKYTRVIVSAGARVYLFTDANGDDRADRREVLFTGIEGVQHDHGIHAVVFGPDGRLYFTFGNEGKRLGDAHGQTVIDLAGNPVVADGKPYRQGMVFRSSLDGSDVETLGWNFRNNWMATVDSFGTVWQSDNDDDGNRAVRINYVMEFGNYGFTDEMTGAGWRAERTGMHEEIPLRHWHLRDPGVVPNMLQTGAGSPAGITVYEGNLLPPVYQNQLLHAEPGTNVARAYLVTDEGAGYQATIKNMLEGARDQWYRPVDVKTAPDGSVIVADWYDPGVGGHDIGDLGHGRLFRITPKGHQGYRVPRFNFSTPAGAAQALKNPAYSVRYIAWQALHAAGAGAERALRRLWLSNNARFRARALWLLGRIEGRGPTYVREAIADKNPDIRITGLRLARQLELDLIPLVETLADDPSPQVRRECAIALRHNRSPQAAELWARLAAAHDGSDRWYLEALGIGADRQWGAFLAAWLEGAGDDWNTPAGRDIIWRSRARQSPDYLAKIIADPSIPATDLPRYFRALDFLPGSRRDAALVRLASLDIGDGGDSDNDRATLIAAESFARLNKHQIDSRPELVAALDRVLDSVRGTKNFARMVDEFAADRRYPELLATAQQQPTLQAGIDAMRLLLDKDQDELIQSGLSNDDVTLAAATATALGNSADGRVVEFLWPIVESDDSRLEVRRQATAALAKSRGGAGRLLEMIRSERLDPRLLEAAAIPLVEARWDTIRSEALQIFPPPPTKDTQQMPGLGDFLAINGDEAYGREIYNTTGTCATCHKVSGEGKEVGPDLSEIGSKLSRTALIESILYPNAGISHNYETYLIALEDGNIVSGVMVSQTDKAVTIKGADAIERTFPRSEIEEIRRQDISLMPADIHKALSVQDLADLVWYMATLKKPK